MSKQINKFLSFQILKFTAQLKTEIQDLRTEWKNRKLELEEKLNEKMDQCRELGNSLIAATEDVKQKNREFLEKEKALKGLKKRKLLGRKKKCDVYLIQVHANADTWCSYMHK